MVVTTGASSDRPAVTSMRRFICKTGLDGQACDAIVSDGVHEVAVVVRAYSRTGYGQCVQAPIQALPASEVAAAAAEAHFAACPRCQRELKSLRSVIDSVRRLVFSSPVPKIPFADRPRRMMRRDDHPRAPLVGDAIE